ncbi:MAG TPA: MopE-related protein [Anaeromyxobacteraceae bacterium]|nr:MopE-related protein [Anaeromyxobacteraceae bacterium]
MTTPRRTTTRQLAGIAPFLLVGLALPLLAPSCGDFSPGVKTFAKGSLIIPMDVCYQCTRQAADGLDTATGSCTKTGYVTSPSGNACPQALAQGDVMKAYGLVYQLIRNDVAVYWIIDPAKAAVDGVDLSIQYGAGFPVQKYDWTAGGPGASPTTAPSGVIRYMGGPFVVDGSDYDKAVAVLKAYQATFSAVNVHVSNVAFQANVAKTMAGGWGAGGAVAPKLALLDIGSGNLSTTGTQPSSTCDTSSTAQCVKSATGWTCINSVKNAEPVIREYLNKAGIGSGTTGGTATGVHGEIYDRLGLADFLPAAGTNDWTTSTFAKNGYQILWVPHWVAPGSCADFSSSCKCLATAYTPADVQQVLATIGAFSAAGGDVFAECAGLASFEGAFSGLTGTGYTVDYQQGSAATRFQTKTGVRYNQLPTSPFPTPSFQPDNVANFASPLLQLGDFPFKPYTGAVEDYKPDDTANADRNYQPGVTRLIGTQYTSGSPAVSRPWDYFTFRDKSSPRGSIVYLAGHSYSGVQGAFQVAGSRLVLNTLFNLGAGCTASGVACDTGLLGACSRGVIKCSATGERVCTPTATPQPETCNGIDDDCNGLVDDNLEQGCYDGPTGTSGVGLCHDGVRSCQKNADGTYGFSACVGQVVPAPEVCNGLDDDCDGRVDQIPDPTTPGAFVPMTTACYSGPDATRSPPGTGTPMGACKMGVQACTAGSWGTCRVCNPGESAPDCQILPVADPCSSPEAAGATALDLNCDGKVDQCGCVNGTSRGCYDGPAGTIGVGLCKAGTQTCSGGAWSTCQGEVTPQKEICNDGIDQNCNGMVDDTLAGGCTSCSASDPQPECWSGPATVADCAAQVPVVFKTATNRSVCVKGTEACVGGQFGACGTGLRPILPGPELCNGLDDDCNGKVDDGAVCGGTGFACENGVCVFSACGPEIPCREGYDCSADHHCKVSGCGGGSACAPGTVCELGSCVDPNAGLSCGAGATAAGGFCTGGGCYEVGCPAGEICQAGACVANPCAGVLCPSGTFCRQGDCVQACAFVTCAAGQRCDADGFCVADPCSDKTCAPGKICVGGACQDDLCLGKACGTGQVCEAGTCGAAACAVCADDPCAGITCPTGQCRGGQCYSTLNPRGAGGAKASGGGGCGCGSGDASPLAFLGILAALPLARRRRRGRGAALLVTVAAAGLLATGCPKKAAPFDPASCTQPGVDLTSCEGESRCVDVQTDPSHCGVCGHACGAGNWCVDGVCGPASGVAPQITGVSPTSAPKGALDPVTVVLSGARFQSGATLRVTSVTATSTTTTTAPTTLGADGKLTAALDLSHADAGFLQLRVVNPDRVISNQAAFAVVLPTPVVTKVIPEPDARPGSSPPAVAVGAQRLLRLVGTGLMQDSACWVGGGTLAVQEVPATLQPAAGAIPAGLECAVDVTRVAPGTYDVWVQNDASHVSAKAAWAAVSGQPVLTSLSPSTAKAGTTASIDLFGSGFDVTSQVVFRVTGVGTVPAGDTQVVTTFVDATHLTAPQLDLARCPGTALPCPDTGTQHYALLVKNGTLASGELELLVQGSPPAISTLSPSSAFQGDTVTLTMTGASIPAGSVIEARAPGAASFTALPVVGTPTATTLQGSLVLVGQPEGQWDVEVRYPAGTSSTFPFRVLSNQAVITSPPDPAGAAQGATVPVTIGVANLRPTTPPVGGVTVVFSGAAGPLTPTQPAAGQLQVALPLSGLDTGVYTLTVVNPNAAPSNGVGFTVTPGLPTVSSVACGAPAGGSTCTAGAPPSAPQQQAKVPVVVTGTNFAKPDAAGNNGSSVHVFAGCTPAVDATTNKVTCTCAAGASPCVPDYVIPAASVTVASATQLQVALDTTAAVPGTYSFWVWNPGGNPAPQRSPGPYQQFKITP